MSTADLFTSNTKKRPSHTQNLSISSQLSSSHRSQQARVHEGNSIKLNSNKHGHHRGNSTRGSNTSLSRGLSNSMRDDNNNNNNNNNNDNNNNNNNMNDHLSGMNNMDSYNSGHSGHSGAENIPNQKHLMKSWLEKRVNETVKKDSQRFDQRFSDSQNGYNNNNNYNNDYNENENDDANNPHSNNNNNNNNVNHNNDRSNVDNSGGNNVGYADSKRKRSEYLENRQGTMRQLSQVSTVADTVIENSVMADVVDELANQANPVEFEFELEEYESSDDEKGGSRVKVKKFRGTNVPNTPLSLVDPDDASSDESTYSDDSQGNNGGSSGHLRSPNNNQKRKKRKKSTKSKTGGSTSGASLTPVPATKTPRAKTTTKRGSYNDVDSSGHGMHRSKSSIVQSLLPQNGGTHVKKSSISRNDIMSAFQGDVHETLTTTLLSGTVKSHKKFEEQTKEKERKRLEKEYIPKINQLTQDVTSKDNQITQMQRDLERYKMEIERLKQSNDEKSQEYLETKKLKQKLRESNFNVKTLERKLVLKEKKGSIMLSGGNSISGVDLQAQQIQQQIEQSQSQSKQQQQQYKQRLVQTPPASRMYGIPNGSVSPSPNMNNNNNNTNSNNNNNFTEASPSPNVNNMNNSNNNNRVGWAGGGGGSISTAISNGGINGVVGNGSGSGGGGGVGVGGIAGALPVIRDNVDGDDDNDDENENEFLSEDIFEKLRMKNQAQSTESAIRRKTHSGVTLTSNTLSRGASTNQILSSQSKPKLYTGALSSNNRNSKNAMRPNSAHFGTSNRMNGSMLVSNRNTGVSGGPKLFTRNVKKAKKSQQHQQQQTQQQVPLGGPQVMAQSQSLPEGNVIDRRRTTAPGSLRYGLSRLKQKNDKTDSVEPNDNNNNNNTNPNANNNNNTNNNRTNIINNNNNNTNMIRNNNNHNSNRNGAIAKSGNNMNPRATVTGVPGRFSSYNMLPQQKTMNQNNNGRNQQPRPSLQLWTRAGRGKQNKNKNGNNGNSGNNGNGVSLEKQYAYDDIRNQRSHGQQFVPNTPQPMKGTRQQILRQQQILQQQQQQQQEQQGNKDAPPFVDTRSVGFDRDGLIPRSQSDRVGTIPTNYRNFDSNRESQLPQSARARTQKQRSLFIPPRDKSKKRGSWHYVANNDEAKLDFEKMKQDLLVKYVQNESRQSMRDIFENTELKKKHKQQNSDSSNSSNNSNRRHKFDFNDNAMNGNGNSNNNNNQNNNNGNNNNNNNENKSQKTKPVRKNNEREENSMLKAQLRKLQDENNALQRKIETYQEEVNKHKAPLPRVVVTAPIAPSPSANTNRFNGQNKNGAPAPPPKSIKLKSNKSSKSNKTNDEKQGHRARRSSGAHVMAYIPDKELSQVPSKAMKKLDWKPIDNVYVHETIWKSIGFSVTDKEALHGQRGANGSVGSHTRNSSMNSELRDEFEYLDELKIPVEFEKLFCDKRTIKATRRGARENSIFSPRVNDSDSQGSRSQSSLLPSPSGLNNIKLQSGIPPKRVTSVRKILRKIKLSPTQIRDCIINVDDTKINKDILYYLLEVAPNFEEMKYVLRKVNKENVLENELNDVELFFYKLADIKHLELRLQLWIFKLKFQDAIDERHAELHCLNQALVDIRDSVGLKKILKIILSFGNFMNANTKDSKHKKHGVYGFQLESLKLLSQIMSNNKSYSLLSYIYKYCRDHRHAADALDVIEELKHCHEASKLNGHDLQEHIMQITNELSKFHRSLRKFRNKKLKSGNSEKTNNESVPASMPKHDEFEMLMRTFHRKANAACKHMLDQWNECKTLANTLAEQYDFDVSGNSYENLIKIFSDFVIDLKKARADLESYEKKQEVRKTRQLKKNDAKKALSSHIKNRPSMDDLMTKNIVVDLELLEAQSRDKEDKKKELNKLVYDHAILLEASINSHVQDPEPMSVRRVNFLKNLAKSNELPGMASNNPEARKKARKRRESLTSNDLPIFELQEDEEAA